MLWVAKRETLTPQDFSQNIFLPKKKKKKSTA
jgi:hypothetical protein